MSFTFKIIILFIFICFWTRSEANCNALTQINQNDTINQTDKNGLKQGIWIIYYNNGEKKSEINYENGVPKGKAIFYYPNGNIRESGNWQVDHWVGDYKYYYESGQLSYDWEYNEKGKREGEQKYFHKNGENKYAGIWINGKTEGVLKVYSEDGVLIQEKVYASGKLNATRDQQQIIAAKDKSSTKSGTVNREKFHGTGNHTIISMTGKVETKGYFVNGELIDGEKFNYNDDGKLISITIYKNGEVSGTKAINNNIN